MSISFLHRSLWFFLGYTVKDGILFIRLECCSVFLWLIAWLPSLKNVAHTVLLVYLHIQLQTTWRSLNWDINGKQWASETHVYKLHTQRRSNCNTQHVRCKSFLTDQRPGWTLHLPVVAVRQPYQQRACLFKPRFGLVSRHLLLLCVPHSQVSRKLFTDLNCQLSREIHCNLPPWLIYLFGTMIILVLNSEW